MTARPFPRGTVRPFTLIVLMLPLALAGCSGIRQALGIERNSPDEFAVIDQAPLVIPPDFKLRPPDDRGGQQRIIDSRRQAASTVFGEGAVDFMDGAVSQAELAFLRAAGTEQADPEIKKIIEWETTGRVTDPELSDRIIKYNGPDEMVAAKAEAQRLRRNRQAGRKPSEGTVPTIERNDGGIIGGIF